MSDTTFHRFYPFTLDADVDATTGEVQRIDLQIAQFTIDQAKAFRRDWRRVEDPPSARFIYRTQDEDEQAKRTVTVGTREREVFVVGDDEIRRRRVHAMDDQARERFLALEEADAEFENDVLTRCVSEYVRVATGQRIVVDGEDGPIEVKTGAELAQAFGGQLPIMRKIGMAVWAENNLGPHEKKVWRSLSGSSISSSMPTPAAVGQRPDGIVAPAASEDSAATAAATASSEPIQSGSTTR